MLASLQPTVFYLVTGVGQRLCVYHQARGPHARTGVLFIHPFAEEMNKSRRMANLQARALAELGYSVLQIDLFGCGDSSGDFGDATPKSWSEDIAAAWDWLEAQSHKSIILWGLRLGATLVLDFAHSQNRWPERFLLWQPVLNGETFMSQVLRLRVASEIIDGGNTGGVRKLREILQKGEAIEVAGYKLNPELALYVDMLRLSRIIPKHSKVNWIELVGDASQSISPATTQAMDAWREAGVDFEFDSAVGPSFWATQEITDCPSLIEKTTSRFASDIN